MDELRWFERLLLRLCPRINAEIEEARHTRAEAINHAMDLQVALRDVREIAIARGNALVAALRAGPDVPDAALGNIAASDRLDQVRKQEARDEIEMHKPDGLLGRW